MNPRYTSTDYRYPYEHLILGLTFIVVLLVITFTATATVCLSAFFIPAVIIFSYLTTRSNHQQLLDHAQQATPQDTPDLMHLIRSNSLKLQLEPVNIFIVPSNHLNAYTFGLDSPKAIVLYSALFKVMDKDELQFILGHEMGHVKLGHTWLNTLVGGMAGIPSSVGAAAIMELAFRWWNRACEYSADRAGVLACGKPNKAISALIKLEAGTAALTKAGIQAAIQHIETEDDDFVHSLEELLASHPMIAKRIEQIQIFVKTPGYQQMQTSMDRNLAS